MKTLLSLVLAFALTPFASAAKDGWTDNLETAKAEAKKENKKVLLDFTGSDWCGWCKKLDAEVFSTQEFKDYAAKHLVLVEVDFPRSIKLPDATKKQNDELQAKYKIQGYPDHYRAEPGRHQGRASGYVEGGPKAFIKSIEQGRR